MAPKGCASIMKLTTDSGIAMTLKLLKLSEHHFVSVFYVFQSFYGYSKDSSWVLLIFDRGYPWRFEKWKFRLKF